MPRPGRLSHRDILKSIERARNLRLDRPQPDEEAHGSEQSPADSALAAANRRIAEMMRKLDAAANEIADLRERRKCSRMFLEAIGADPDRVERLTAGGSDLPWAQHAAGILVIGHRSQEEQERILYRIGPYTRKSIQSSARKLAPGASPQGDPR